MEATGTVHLVDDDKSASKAIAAILQSVQLDVRAYTDAKSFLEGFRSSPPQCLLLDLYMPSMTGLELQSQLEAANIDIPIVFLTGHGDVATAVEALKHGALDFIEKPARSEQIIDSVLKAIREDVAAMTRRSETSEYRQRLDSLSERERQVLDAVARGLSSKQIAFELGLSKKTIDLHRTRIMRKLGVGSATELVRVYVMSQRDA